MANMTELTLRIQRSDNLNTVKVDDTVGAGNGRHYYEIERDRETLAQIQFQHGAKRTRLDGRRTRKRSFGNRKTPLAMLSKRRVCYARKRLRAYVHRGGSYVA